MKLTLLLFWVMMRCNWRKYPFGPIPGWDPKTSYLSYNITLHHNPKELQHQRFIFSPRFLDQLWVPPSAYSGLSPHRYNGWGLRMITYFPSV